MYYLKYSDGLWNQKVIKFFKDIRFSLLKINSSIHIKKKTRSGRITPFIIYLNHFLLRSNTLNVISNIKKSLAKKYSVKDLKETKIIIS